MKVSQKELSLAIEFINCLRTEKLRMSKYHDQYREALVKIIEAKLAGRRIPVPEIEAPKVMELAEALAASIEATKKGAK